MSDERQGRQAPRMDKFKVYEIGRMLAASSDGTVRVAGEELVHLSEVCTACHGSGQAGEATAGGFGTRCPRCQGSGLECLPFPVEARYFHTLVQAHYGRAREDLTVRTLRNLHADLVRLVESTSDRMPAPLTGWVALMARDGGGWKCVGVMRADDPGLAAPNWEVLVPIPEPSAVEEWGGP